MVIMRREAAAWVNLAYFGQSSGGSSFVTMCLQYLQRWRQSGRCWGRVARRWSSLAATS